MIGDNVDKSSEETSDIENEKEGDSCNGTKESVAIFNPRCVICLEQPSVYAFRQCGHHC